MSIAKQIASEMPMLIRCGGEFSNSRRSGVKKKNQPLSGRSNRAKNGASAAIGRKINIHFHHPSIIFMAVPVSSGPGDNDGQTPIFHIKWPLVSGK